MPGHTLISVYHQYPSNATPTSNAFSSDSSNLKDCIPPEPTPSTVRNSEGSRPNIPPVEQPLPMTSSIHSLPNSTIESKQNMNLNSNNRLVDVPVTTASVDVVKNNAECVTKPKSESLGSPALNSYKAAEETVSNEQEDGNFRAVNVEDQNEHLESSNEKPTTPSAQVEEKEEEGKCESNSSVDRSVLEIVESVHHAEMEARQMSKSESDDTEILPKEASTSEKSEEDVKAEPSSIPSPKAQSCPPVSFSVISKK